ncbi:MAG: hypothetical protein WB992_12775 [Bryobacteraceae bacterium]
MRISQLDSATEALDEQDTSEGDIGVNIPTLAEDARAGRHATRLVYLGGGNSPHFSGCDSAMMLESFDDSRKLASMFSRRNSAQEERNVSLQFRFRPFVSEEATGEWGVADSV